MKHSEKSPLNYDNTARAEHIAYAMKPYKDMAYNTKAAGKDTIVKLLDTTAYYEGVKAEIIFDRGIKHERLNFAFEDINELEIDMENQAHIFYAAKEVALAIQATNAQYSKILYEPILPLNDFKQQTEVADIHTLLDTKNGREASLVEHIQSTYKNKYNNYTFSQINYDTTVGVTLMEHRYKKNGVHLINLAARKSFT